MEHLFQFNPKDFEPTKEELMTVRMKSPPMCFWGFITPNEFDAMSDEQRKKIIEVAKKIYANKDFDFKSLASYPNATINYKTIF